MPEAPDLEVIKEVLIRRITGCKVSYAKVLKPTVLRSVAAPNFPEDVTGRTVERIARKGKFLLLHLSPDRILAINPMLTGAFQLCSPQARVFKRTCLIIGVGQELEMRYIDDRQMGLVYYVEPAQLAQVPRLNEQGPDVLDGDISFPEFKTRLRPYYGEIKGVLTRGAFISGIGNAYSDEILFSAGISPFRKRKSLSDEELMRLHRSLKQVTSDAVAILRERMEEETHHKIRDFLQVHNKGGKPCPRCGNKISQLTANQQITSYCRHCQPGMLIKS